MAEHKSDIAKGVIYRPDKELKIGVGAGFSIGELLDWVSEAFPSHEQRSVRVANAEANVVTIVAPRKNR